VYVTFTLDTPSSGGESITVATFDNTATAPGDYTAKSLVIEFGRNQIQRKVALQVRGDVVAEPEENFIIDVVASSGLACGVTAAPGVITIIDDD
jgi:chitinase